MLWNCDVGEVCWESFELQWDPTSPSSRRSVLSVHWMNWCWSWNSNTLATWWEEMTHWKRPWCWERLKVGGEGDDRGWDGWMASLTQWTWVWVNSWSWWWTRRPGVLQSMGLQRIRHDWATELNWNNFQIPLSQHPGKSDNLFLMKELLSLQWSFYFLCSSWSLSSSIFLLKPIFKKSSIRKHLIVSNIFILFY